MAVSKFSQLHRRLLFHWTGPRPEKTVRIRENRILYLDLLESILTNGLRYSRPDDSNWEEVFNGAFVASRRMICLSEWGLGESAAHSGRYGWMGFGFTRKFVMAKGGRPVVYVSNSRRDPFRKALQRVLETAEQDGELRIHADLVANYLKAYHLPRPSPMSNRRRQAPDVKKDKKSSLTSRTQPDDSKLKLDFGGIFANLEDREWRILDTKSTKGGSTGATPYLSFQPGELAMIVFPDHQTLTMAMRNTKILDRINIPDKPAVCLVSREMFSSM
jgi:hypothetical protein